MSAKWTSEGNIASATINGNEYQVYETEPGMQRLRRNGRLIAETFTAEEAKRWAEAYDKWLEQELPKLPKKEPKLPEIMTIGDLMAAYEDVEWQRFPCYPREMEGGNPI